MVSIWGSAPRPKVSHANLPLVDAVPACSCTLCGSVNTNRGTWTTAWRKWQSTVSVMLDQINELCWFRKSYPGRFLLFQLGDWENCWGTSGGKNKIVLEPNQNVCIFMYLHREQPIPNICQVLAVFCVSLNAYLLILLHQQVPDGSEFSPTEVSFFYSLILCWQQ